MHEHLKNSYKYFDQHKKINLHEMQMSICKINVEQYSF